MNGLKRVYTNREKIKCIQSNLYAKANVNCVYNHYNYVQTMTCFRVSSELFKSK